MVKVAFLGLGVMGYPMARHLKTKGHTVTVYNRTQAKAHKWVGEHGGHAAPTPRAAAEGQDIVFACVGNDDDLRAVTLGNNGAFAVDWMRKDLGIVLDEARHNHARLPLTALVDQFYGEVQALGGNRWDTSSLLARLESKSK